MLENLQDKNGALKGGMRSPTNAEIGHSSDELDDRYRRESLLVPRLCGPLP